MRLSGSILNDIRFLRNGEQEMLIDPNVEILPSPFLEEKGRYLPDAKTHFLLPASAGLIALCSLRPS